tara:strand:- start:309 stop:686 length:378 start_codon:yes stop_codon:yes gene_type:complete
MKEELELKIKELEASKLEYQGLEQSLNIELSKARSIIADYNKPTISIATLEDIRTAIHAAVNDIPFDEPDSYDLDFCISYDNKLGLEHIDFTDRDEISDRVADGVESLFKIENGSMYNLDSKDEQ